MNGVNNLLLVINASVNFIIYIMISGPGKGIKVQSVPLGKKLGGKYLKLDNFIGQFQFFFRS